MRFPGETGDVDNFEGRVGGAFKVQQPAAFGHRFFYGFLIRGVAQGDVNLKARQELGEQLVGSAVAVFNRYHPISRREKSK